MQIGQPNKKDMEYAEQCLFEFRYNVATQHKKYGEYDEKTGSYIPKDGEYFRCSKYAMDQVSEMQMKVKKYCVGRGLPIPDYGLLMSEKSKYARLTDKEIIEKWEIEDEASNK